LNVIGKHRFLTTHSPSANLLINRLSEKAEIVKEIDLSRWKHERQPDWEVF